MYKAEILTAEELKAKGITAKDVKGMIRRLETRIAKYLARNLAGLTTATEQKEWDMACSHHDHAKAALRILEAR